MPLILPTVNDYQQIMQNPDKFLGDQRLKKCRVESDQLGMPKVRSGGFALTYRLENGSQKWALRCFHKVALERESRYAAICRYLSSHSSKILIPVEYMPQGILSKGIWYPVTLMEWIEGDTLSNYLYKNIGNQQLISNLPEAFKRLVSELERLHIAHGDLSHLNILVRSGDLILIDYDGMFVPELKGQKSNELGNSHFQHPRRTEFDFNPDLDWFSEIVIYLSLKSLALSPNLYNEYGKGGEGLIFKKEDFINSSSSKLLLELEKLPELRILIQQFRGICSRDIKNIPSLSVLLDNRPIELPQTLSPTQSVQNVLTNIFKTFDASMHETLLENENEYVTVVGKITEVTEKYARNKLPYAKLNFGDWHRQCFTIVLWSEALELLRATGRTPSGFQDKWVSVTGLLSVFRNDYGVTPQITLDSPSNIEIIAEIDAKQRLATGRVVHQPSGISGQEKVFSTPASPITLKPTIKSQSDAVMIQNREIKKPDVIPIPPKRISSVNPSVFPTTIPTPTMNQSTLPEAPTSQITQSVSRRPTNFDRLSSINPSKKKASSEEASSKTEPILIKPLVKRSTFWEMIEKKVKRFFKILRW